MPGHGRDEPAAEELAAIRAGATLMLRKCQEGAHVERALLAAIDQHELVQNVIMDSVSAAVTSS